MTPELRLALNRWSADDYWLAGKLNTLMYDEPKFRAMVMRMRPDQLECYLARVKGRFMDEEGVLNLTDLRATGLHDRLEALRLGVQLRQAISLEIPYSFVAFRVADKTNYLPEIPGLYEMEGFFNLSANPDVLKVLSKYYPKEMEPRVYSIIVEEGVPLAIQPDLQRTKLGMPEYKKYVLNSKYLDAASIQRRIRESVGGNYKYERGGFYWVDPGARANLAKQGKIGGGIRGIVTGPGNWLEVAEVEGALQYLLRRRR